MPSTPSRSKSLAPDRAEAELGVLLEVDPVVDRAADAEVDGAFFGEQSLLERAAQDGAVGDRGAEVVVPGVEVCVEVDQRQRAVLAGDGAEHRQGDRVVAADRDELAVAAVAVHFVGVPLDLVDGLTDVERCARDVSGVDDLLLAEGGHVELDGVRRAEMA